MSVADIINSYFLGETKEAVAEKQSSLYGKVKILEKVVLK